MRELVSEIGEGGLRAVEKRADRRCRPFDCPAADLRPRLPLRQERKRQRCYAALARAGSRRTESSFRVAVFRPRPEFGESGNGIVDLLIRENGGELLDKRILRVLSPRRTGA